MSYNPQNPNGQATSANSAPVVIASDQSTLPVSLSGGATSANQTNGTQQTQITDGTNIANVLSPGTANSNGNAVLVANTNQTVTFSTTTAQAVASTDAGNYRSVSLVVTSQGSSSSVAFQQSLDNVNWYSIALLASTSTGATGSSTLTGTTGIIYSGPLVGRYFRLNVSGITAGTTAGVVVFSTLPYNPVTTVAAVSTPNATGSAVPTTGFYQGANAATALPTASSAGSLTGLMSDKFGRQVVLSNAQRDLVLPITQLTLTSTTTETTLISSVASTYLDLVSLVIINTSSTPTQVDFRDSTAGTVRLSFYIPAGDTRGIALPVPMPQNTSANNWTAKCGTSVASIIITGTYITNK